jgi:hypothetical protein
MRMVLGIDDVDMAFDEHLRKLALVVLRVGAARVRTLDHDARVVDRQAIHDVGVACGNDAVGARHHFVRREAQLVHEPAVDVSRLQMFLARRRGDAHQLQELMPARLGGGIRTLVLDERQDLRIGGDFLRGRDHRRRDRRLGAGLTGRRAVL